MPKVLRRKEGQFITVICPKFLVWSALEGQEDEVHEQRQQGEGQGGGQRERLPEPASLRAVPRPFVHPACRSPRRSPIKDMRIKSLLLFPKKM